MKITHHKIERWGKTTTQAVERAVEEMVEAYPEGGVEAIMWYGVDEAKGFPVCRITYIKLVDE